MDWTGLRKTSLRNQKLGLAIALDLPHKSHGHCVDQFDTVAYNVFLPWSEEEVLKGGVEARHGTSTPYRRPGHLWPTSDTWPLRGNYAVNIRLLLVRYGPVDHRRWHEMSEELQALCKISAWSAAESSTFGRDLAEPWIVKQL